MKGTAILSCLATAVVSFVVPKPDYASYNGYKVFRIDTHRELKTVQEKLSSIPFDQWNHDIARHMDVVISPDHLEQFHGLGLKSHCMHEDLGASISRESQTISSWKRQVGDMSWFDSYHSYEEHQEYFNSLHASLPDNSELVSSGTSYEGRDIFGIHMWGNDGPGKPAVLWHGTVHAREWITAMAIEYITTQLATGFGSDNETTAFLDSYDFYIFPFVNPDGFVYTQTNNRLWRKNRQPPPTTAVNQTCIGRDVNRNWPFQWAASPEGIGASSNPCAQTYAGEAPSDSPENQGLVAFVDKLKAEQSIRLYIDFHSYGQYILAPYGYNCTVYADGLGEHIKLAALTGEAIRDGGNGTTFTFGPTCSTLYAATGGSNDYVYAEGGARFAYAFELRDTGDYGFVLPPAQIRGVGEEMWAGVQVMLSLLDEVFFDNEGPVVGT